MHLLILGLVLIVGILVYYIMTTSSGGKDTSSTAKKRSSERCKSTAPENLRKEDNVIFLPRADGTDGAAEPAPQSDDNDPDTGE